MACGVIGVIVCVSSTPIEAGEHIKALDGFPNVASVRSAEEAQGYLLPQPHPGVQVTLAVMDPMAEAWMARLDVPRQHVSVLFYRPTTPEEEFYAPFHANVLAVHLGVSADLILFGRKYLQLEREKALPPVFRHLPLWQELVYEAVGSLPPHVRDNFSEELRGNLYEDPRGFLADLSRIDNHTDAWRLDSNHAFFLPGVTACLKQEKGLSKLAGAVEAIANILQLASKADFSELGGADILQAMFMDEKNGPVVLENLARLKEACSALAGDFLSYPTIMALPNTLRLEPLFELLPRFPGKFQNRRSVWNA